VNGKLCCVRENLYNFLNTFSKPQTAEERDYLWIDQICIDQSDVGERNHQVGMMADIYRNCDFVITWLDASASKGADSIRDGWVFDQLQHPEVNMDRIAYKCVNKFLKNRYFTRLWIVQEVLLAPEVLILCANIWLEWNDVKKAILSVQAHWFDRLPDAKFLFTRREQNYGPGRFRMREDFPVYLTLYSSMGCVDPRDKVYGLLGLAGTEQRDFVVDYNKPVQEVLFDVVQFVTFRETSKYSTEFIEAGAKAICKNMRLPKDDTTALTISSTTWSRYPSSANGAITDRHAIVPIVGGMSLTASVFTISAMVDSWICQGASVPDKVRVPITFRPRKRPQVYHFSLLSPCPFHLRFISSLCAITTIRTGHSVFSPALRILQVLLLINNPTTLHIDDNSSLSNDLNTWIAPVWLSCCRKRLVVRAVRK
jgi:hypothetical protein